MDQAEFFVLMNFILQLTFNEIKGIISILNNISFQHVFMERNTVDDNLSKEGLLLDCNGSFKKMIWTSIGHRPSSFLVILSLYGYRGSSSDFQVIFLFINPRILTEYY